MEWVWQWGVRSSIQPTFVVWAAIPKQISNTHAAGGAPTLICNSLHNKDAGCVLSCDVTPKKNSVMYSACQIRRLRTLLWRHTKQRLSGVQWTFRAQRLWPLTCRMDEVKLSCLRYFWERMALPVMKWLSCLCCNYSPVIMNSPITFVPDSLSKGVVLVSEVRVHETATCVTRDVTQYRCCPVPAIIVPPFRHALVSYHTHALLSAL